MLKSEREGELIDLRGVIFVAGVYGVGKSTICSRLSNRLNIPFYSAGDLISEQVNEVYGRNKQVKNKELNQNVLVECVKTKLEKEKMLILAGHFCILGHDNKPDILPEFVFYNMNINAIVLLEADVDTVCSNLECRDNKSYERSLIERFIEVERQQARKIAKELNIPIKVHKMNFDRYDEQSLTEYFMEVCDESVIRH